VTIGAEPPVITTAQVLGVKEAMSTLQKLEPALKRAAMKDIKLAAEPLRAAVAIALPATAPLSGMDHRGRTGWLASGARTVGTKYGGRARTSGTVKTWPLVSILVKGVGGSIYDMAGRASSGATAQGSALIAGLTAEGGMASRAAWPAAEARMMTIQSAVMKACESAADTANMSLARR